MNNDQWGNIELPGLSDDELLNKNWNFAKTQEDKQRRSQTVKKVAQQRDEVYMEKLHQGIAQRDNSYQAINNADPKVRAKISVSMQQHEKTQEHLDKVAKKNRERAKPCITPLGVFASGKEAGLAYNQARGSTNGKNAVSNALKKGKEGYRFITVEEYIMLTGKDI